MRRGGRSEQWGVWGWWLGRGAGGGEGLPLAERERGEAEAAQFAAEHASYWTSELQGSSAKSHLNMIVETDFFFF